MKGHASYPARFPMAVGLVALALLVGGMGSWSATSRLAGAVIAPGAVVVEHERQVVQHAEGGIVGQIVARDGAQVQAGDVLIRLDGTRLATDLAIVDHQLIELGARSARLTAERDGADAVVFPDELAGSSDATIADQVAGQRRLFDARRAALAIELSQVGEMIAQGGQQIAGIEAQLAALERQKALIAEELRDQETLLAKGLVQMPRVLGLRREAARLDGDIGRHIAEIARLKSQIAGFRIERPKLTSDRREAAIAELRDSHARALELTETRADLTERLARLEIRAPVSGVVFGSTVFAAQSVIRPADPLMFIVPQDRPMAVRAQVTADKIDRVYPGQPATLRFTAFNQRQTPEISATVVAVSADAFADEATQSRYYRVELRPDDGALAALPAGGLRPGMQVEVHLRTEDRTPLSYFVKPLSDYFQRSLREG